MTTTHHMTPAGKEALRKTIRGLRESLISQLKEEAERVYRLGVSLSSAKLSEANAARRVRLEAWVEEQGRADFAGGAGASGAGGAGAGGKKAGKKGAAAGKESKKPSEKQQKELRERYLTLAVKEAAHTLINRLVILRLMEAGGLSQPAVVSGGWSSAGYREFQDYAGALCRDAGDGTRGYGALLQVLFDELAVELPGVFGKVGLTSLFPVPAATLREVVEALNEPALDSVWRDDTTLGWVYQFWNDPEFEALNDKLSAGGKLENHEIAPKTQIFTERYQVNWLLQNALGQQWESICALNGWTPDFHSAERGLAERRAKALAHRLTSEEAMAETLAAESELEERWKYRVHGVSDENISGTGLTSIRELKLLDPACGSGHFLVIAFDLLGALYAEEARARGEPITAPQIAQNILEHNLHGVDIDARAIQIAAAALYLKAKLWVKAHAEKTDNAHSELRITRLNLVAPTFKLAALPKDDPALLELKKRLKVEAGIPESLTESLLEALGGVDHLGTLLRVDKSVRAALEGYEQEYFGLRKGSQIGMFGEQEKKTKVQLSLDEAEASVVEQLARFLDAHEGESDLGLRLEGEQLAAGVRFLQMVREGTFDVVVGNPPYQGTSKMAEADWFKKHYPRSKADLYACFLERGLELVKPGGLSGLLTMRGWLFLSSYEALRKDVAKRHGFKLVADLQYRAFSEIGNIVVAMSLVQRDRPSRRGVALRPRTPDRRVEDMPQLLRNIAGLEYQDERFEFDVAKLSGIEGTPLVYWWDEEFLAEYVKAPKLGEVAPVRQGMASSDDTRFVRRPFEVGDRVGFDLRHAWVPFIKGGAGKAWFEPLEHAVTWRRHGLEVKALAQLKYGSYTRTIKNEGYYFRQGVAFLMIGSTFSGRVHRFPSVFGHMGSSVFPEVDQLGHVLCAMNTSAAQNILGSLNPGVHYEVGDVNRLAETQDPQANDVMTTLRAAFTLHESHREPSVEFKQPGPSPWRAAQDWAQRAVDRPKGEQLPSYEEELDPPDPTAFVSFALGVALGRFGENGEGILDVQLAGVHGGVDARHPMQRVHNGADTVRGGERAGTSNTSDSIDDASRIQKKALASAPGQPQTGAKNGKGLPSAKSRGESSQFAHSVQNAATDPLSVPNIEPSPLPEGQEILPDGILFISAAPHVQDSRKHPAFARVSEAWGERWRTITGGKTDSLGEWLRRDFFAYHKSLYENRPIYFPLSSAGKSFVAFVSIHCWTGNTLSALLAHHLHPARERLQGEINDLNQARASSDKKAASTAEKQYEKTQKLAEELEAFVTEVTQIAEKGAPPTDIGGKNACPRREVDAPFRMDLDDGVMINSAALWPLLEPQWKDPKKWWKELCTADGRKDYDWAHLAARYFPTRVDEKCKTDPSLGVAHGCFWKYHPAKAYAWELRLQDEIGPEFTIDEATSDKYRAEFLRDHPKEAEEIRAKEEQRRERNRKKAERGEKDNEDNGCLFAPEDEPRA